MTYAGLLWLMLALPFAGSLAAAFLPSRARNAAALLAGAVAVAGTVLAAVLYSSVPTGALVRSEVQWLPQLGLNLLIRLDGLAWMFAILILGIGSLIVLYARYYMSAADPVPRFFSFLLAFMGSMLGLVLSGNLIQLVFFWELTSLFSFLLIGYWHQNAAARVAARMALIVTAAGGLCLLVGVLLIGRVVGSYDLDQVLASAALIKDSRLYLPILVLVLFGAFTKSAQFPFHFWLPHAMAAPTPVSAYLHSATMVKAGVFILIRMWPVLAGTEAWYYLVSIAGLTTLVLGAWAAMFQQDIKGLLAYSTISHLGIITLLLGMSNPLGLVAAVFHTINHALFKASLFMATGIIDHETGTRDVRRLSGLLRYMPITGSLAMVAAAAMAGVPLLNGFLSKEMFLAGALHFNNDGLFDLVMPYIATVGLTFSVLYSLRFIHQTFFGPPPHDIPKVPHEVALWVRAPIGILVVACLAIGMLPAATIGPYLAEAVWSVLGADTPQYSLAVWHGFNQPLVLSVLALVAGAAGYYLMRDRLNEVDGPPVMRRFKGRRMFEGALAALIDGAQRVKARIGTRRLQVQLRVLVAVAGVAALLPFLRYGYSLGDRTATPIEPAFALTWLVGAACAVGAAWLAKYNRLAALILLGGAGLASCISFVWLSAPDLALTQLLVETVTTVLLLLSLRWLPKRVREIRPAGRTPFSVFRRRGGDLLLAVAAGLGMAMLAYAMMTRPLPPTISRWFIDLSYSEGGGRNVVNVTLVDFRAFDTLGEITVLAIVALTVFSVLRRFRPARESVLAPLQQQNQDRFDLIREERRAGDTLADTLLVPRVVMEWMYPVIVALALYLLLRGHDLPGGGFAAGIAMSTGLVLQYMSAGTRSVELRLRVRPLAWIGVGLLLALATGAGAWLFGRPFLTTGFRYLELPVIGKVPASTALIFDIGVFLLVIGATALILIAIAHQTLRTPRRPIAGPATPKPDAGSAAAEES